MSVISQIRSIAAVLPTARRHRSDFARAMARRPQLLVATMGYELGIVACARVEARLKILAELKVASIVSCEHCLDIGSAIARHEGLHEDQLRDLHRHRDSEAFDETERTVLDVADALTRSPAVIDDELRTRFDRHFTSTQQTELLAVIAWENQRARLNQGLGIRSAGFSDGAFCALPAPATTA